VLCECVACSDVFIGSFFEAVGDDVIVKVYLLYRAARQRDNFRPAIPYFTFEPEPLVVKEPAAFSAKADMVQHGPLDALQMHPRDVGDELLDLRASLRTVEALLGEEIAEAGKLAAAADLPDDLRRQITDALDDDRGQSWDMAVMGVAQDDAADIDDDDADDSA